MGKIYNLGETVTLLHTFYDTSGGAVSPSSVRVTLSYPSSSFDYTFVRESTFATMTQSTVTLVWSASIATTQMHPGAVYFSIRPSSGHYGVEDGQFELRANAANLATT